MFNYVQKYFLVFLSISLLQPIRAMDIFKKLDFVSIVKKPPVPDSSNEIPTSSFEENEEREQRKVINDKIEKRELERIKSSLKEGLQVDLDVYIGPGKSIMALAAEHNDIELLELLLDRGADINICDLIGNTALHAAIVKNNNFLCEYLLKKGASPNIKNKITGNTLLDSAILFKNINALKLLIKYNADVNKDNATLLIEDIHFDPKCDSKKYYLCTKTVLLILNRYNNLVPGINDLRFLILEYLPEYHCHSGLYKQLQTRKHELKPFAFYVIDRHTKIIQEILHIKNKNDKNILEMFPSITKLNEKLLKDSTEFKEKYPDIIKKKDPDISAIKDNLAFQILKKYAFKYDLLIPEDVLAADCRHSLWLARKDFM